MTRILCVQQIWQTNFDQDWQDFKTEFYVQWFLKALSESLKILSSVSDEQIFQSDRFSGRYRQIVGIVYNLKLWRLGISYHPVDYFDQSDRS